MIPFTPLTFDVVSSLSEETRRLMTLDFIRQEKPDSVRSLLPLVPLFLPGQYHSSSFDASLLTSLIRIADLDWFNDVLSLGLSEWKKYHAHSSMIHRLPKKLDLGLAFCLCCERLNKAKLTGNETLADTERQKIQILLTQFEVDLLEKEKHASGKGYDLSFIDSAYSYDPMHPLAVAFSLKDQEPFILKGLLERPEWQQQLDLALFPHLRTKSFMNLPAHELALVSMFTNASIWQRHSEFLANLIEKRIDRMRSVDRVETTLSLNAHVLSFAMTARNKNDPDVKMPGRLKLAALCGESVYSMCLGKHGGALPSPHSSSSLVPSMVMTGQALIQLLDQLKNIAPFDGEERALAQALYYRATTHQINDHLLKETLFSHNAALREATRAYYQPYLWETPTAPAQSPSAGSPSPSPTESSSDEEAHPVLSPDSALVNPYVHIMSLLDTSRSHSSFHYHHLMESMSKTQDPDVVLASLQACGKDRFLVYPNDGREGLDSSCIMLIALHGNDEVFEAALKWLDGQGILDEAASKKAWVMNESNTRKKGDLLAFCVAKADLNKAKLFLKIRPDWKTTLARDTAKAMGSKLHNEAAGKAVSAWESLLFSKVLESFSEEGKKAKQKDQADLQSEPDKVAPEEQPAPVRQRHRL